jgi:NADPH-dependent glutamate synthase beta subunit-like oxidoreductase
MLVKEAIGKIIAQNLVNREGIDGSIRYVSERTLNVILNNFSYGEADDVDLMLKELQDEVSSIVSDFYQDRLNIELFDADNILKAKDFYKIEKGIS